MHWSIELLLLISFLLYLLHLYLSRHFNYWKNKNVPYLKPRPFVGNMMDMIIQKYEMEGDKMLAQVLGMFVAGTETTATTIALTLHALCLHPDIQEKLRQNIKDVIRKHNGQLTVESIGEMSYLDLVIKETLRKYPPVPTLDRVCTADYKIPGTEVVIEKGTIVIVSTFGPHYDPQFYAKPEEYIPERFESLEEDFVYLAFGQGPRGCIGRRFGLLMVKIAIVRVLQKFDVHSTDETPVSVDFSPTSLLPQPTEKLLLGFTKVNE